MITPTSARHALQLLLNDFASNAEVTQKITDYIQALPQPDPDAYLVEIEDQVGDEWVVKRHVVLDKPEGYYLECSTGLYRDLDHAQATNLKGLVKAGRKVMSWVEAAHRPPVRDEFEHGRMARVRIHALADLREALLPFGDQPAPSKISESVVVRTNKSGEELDLASLAEAQNLTELTYAFERMGYVGMDKVRQSIAKMEGEPGYDPNPASEGSTTEAVDEKRDISSPASEAPENPNARP